MESNSRIKRENVAIDHSAVKNFFEKRGRKVYANALSTTMYQDHEPDLVSARDKHEKDRVEGLLGLKNSIKVLDIGCGIGRWGWFLRERCRNLDYLGIDFSSSLVAIAEREAEKRGSSDTCFQVASAVEVNADSLLRKPPFDLILIAGLLIYLNDNEASEVLRKAGMFCAVGGRIYLREPVGVGERLTLNGYYSSELAGEYSAIYRTQNELGLMFKRASQGMSFEIIDEGYLYPDELEKRAETRQFFTVLKRIK